MVKTRPLYLYLALGLISITGIFLAIDFITNASVYFGEGHIIGPVVKHLKGKPYPILVYPTFSYFFYEYLYKFISLFKSVDIWQLSRIINATLLGVNGLLFYLASEKYLERPWRVFGAFLFIFSPGVFYSSIVIKTESLQLMLILLTLYFSERSSENRSEWHLSLTSGIIAGLGISTKYNPTLFLIYFLTQYYKTPRIGEIFKRRKTWIFILSFITTILLTWSTLFKLLAFLFSSEKLLDLYTVNFPTTAQAVNEWGAFPYGKYSYAFILIMPFVAGIPNYLGLLLGLFTFRVPKKALLIWGGFTLAYLLLILNFTLMRLPHIFTVCVPFITLASLYFWQDLFKRSNTFFKIVLPLTLILWSFFHYKELGKSVYSIVEIEKNELGQHYRLKNIFYLLNNSNTAQVNKVRGDQILKAIKERDPKYILALNTYMMSFCKYKKNPSYIEQCEYFKKLMKEEGNYKINWSKSANFSYLGLLNEKHTYFLFQRRD